MSQIGLPILNVGKDKLSITASDLEVELVARADVDNVDVSGDITVPGRKLLDICRSLPESSIAKFSLKGDRLTLQSGRSKFVLATLGASDFPLVENINADRELTLAKSELSRVLASGGRVVPRRGNFPDSGAPGPLA